MYVSIETEPGLHTVGFFNPSGKFQPFADCDSKQEAETKINILNGGNYELKLKIKELSDRLEKVIQDNNLVIFHS